MLGSFCTWDMVTGRVLPELTLPRALLTAAFVACGLVAALVAGARLCPGLTGGGGERLTVLVVLVPRLTAILLSPLR